MGSLRVLSGEEVCSILGAHGFARVRSRGSHAVMQRRLPDTTITVPVLMHRDVRRGTLVVIIRQSRLPRELFEV